MRKNNGGRQDSCWMLQTKRADFGALSKRFHISPVTARIIRNREVVGDGAVEKYLHGTLRDLYNPHLLKGMDQAAGILEDKIKSGHPGHYWVSYATQVFCLPDAILLSSSLHHW